MDLATLPPNGVTDDSRKRFEEEWELKRLRHEAEHWERAYHEIREKYDELNRRIARIDEQDIEACANAFVIKHLKGKL